MVRSSQDNLWNVAVRLQLLRHAVRARQHGSTHCLSADTQGRQNLIGVGLAPAQPASRSCERTERLAKAGEGFWPSRPLAAQLAKDAATAMGNSAKRMRACASMIQKRNAQLRSLVLESLVGQARERV